MSEQQTPAPATPSSGLFKQSAPQAPQKVERQSRESIEDPELKAISRCIKDLSSVPPDGQRRILDYLVNKFLGAKIT
jgi:hypothetical protein